MGRRRSREIKQLSKCPSGIRGLDDITAGGLPRGRPTLVCGAAGCGKSLLAMEFLVRGITQYGEPGVLMSFEEPAHDIATNVTSLGFDVEDLVARKQLVVDYVRVERSEIQETGEYDLEGLFIRLGHAIDTVGAKRVVLDTIESLFSGLSNAAVLRAELRRLFHWLKARGVTAVITGEQGEKTLTRQGLEEYVSDCVIFLDHRIIEQVSTRRLRVVKYRGTTHGTNEYPFLIDADGITVLPITSLGLQHEVSSARVSTGVAGLDQMLGGQGLYRGSSVLISGTAGTGKSSFAAHFVDAACRRGERCLYLAFEESPGQIIRNMRSIGLDLEPWVRKGLLELHASRPTFYGLETHLAVIHKLIREFDPPNVVVDPISNLVTVGSPTEVRTTLLRLIDLLKCEKRTAILTNLTSAGNVLEGTDLGVSSLIDTWFQLRDIELNGERNRGIYVLKSRGMNHSNQIREYLLTDHGIELREVCLGPGGVLTGSTRAAQELQERAAQAQQQEEARRRRRQLEHKRLAMEAQVAALRASYEAEEEEANKVIGQEETRDAQLRDDRLRLARERSTAGDNGEAGRAPARRGRGKESRR